MEATTDGSNFVAVSGVTGNVASVATGNSLRLKWDSRTLVSGTNSVQLRVVPADAYNVGTSVLSDVIELDNSTLSAITNVQITGNEATIEVHFDLVNPSLAAADLQLWFSIDGGTQYHRTDAWQNEVLPATGLSILWRSDLFITGNQADVRIKLIPTSEGKEGVAGVSTPFTVNNFDELYYYGSEIVGLTTTGTVGDLQLDFGISGEVGVFYDLKLEYQLADSTDWQQAKNITGTLQDTRIGAHQLLWHSGSEIEGDQTVSVRVTPFLRVDHGDWSEEQLGIAMEKADIKLQNGLMPTATILSTEVTTEPQVKVTYQIEGDATFEVELFYIENGGEAVQIAPNLITGTTAGRVFGTQEYECIVTLPTRDFENTALAIVPYRISSRIKGVLTTTPVRNFYFNKPPVIKIIDVTNGTGESLLNQSGSTSFTFFPNFATNEIKIQFKVIDENKDDVELNIGWGRNLMNIFVTEGWLSGGYYTWVLSDLILADLTHFNREIFMGGRFPAEPLPFASGTDEISAPIHTITWRSAEDFARNYSNIYLQLRARDGNPRKKWGTRTIGKIGEIKNSTAPIIEKLTFITHSGEVLVGNWHTPIEVIKENHLTLKYNLFDAGTLPCEVIAEYSLNGLDYTQFYQQTDIIPAKELEIIWNPLAVLPNRVEDTVSIRLTAIDRDGDQGQLLSSTFKVINNLKPEVIFHSIIDNVKRKKQINFTLNDAEGDTCYIAFQYSENGGVTWSPIKTLDFGDPAIASTNLASNRQYTAVWKTYYDYHKTRADIKVRLVPSHTIIVGAKERIWEGTSSIKLTSISNGVEGKITGITYDGQVFVMNADGGEKTIIGPGERSYIADDKLVYERYRKIYATDNQGNGITQVTPDTGAYSYPQLSYKGTKNEMVYYRGNWSSSSGGPYGDLVRHSDKRNLTFNAGGLSDWYWQSGLGYSADGREIVYVASNGAEKEIWIVNTDTGTRINHFPYDPSMRSTQFIKPITPDGKAFLVEKDNNIFSMNKSLGELKQLTKNGSDGAYTFQKMWRAFYSSDMSCLYFTGTSIGSNHIYRIYADVDDSPAVLVASGVGMSFSNGYQSAAPDEPPVFSIVSIEQVDLKDNAAHNPVKITYNMGDVNGDTAELKLYYSIEGVTYNREIQHITFPGEQNENGLGLNRVIYWNVAEEDGAVDGSYRIRATPTQSRGGINGSGIITDYFPVQINRKPEIKILAIDGNSKDLTITYNLSDPDQNSCSVSLQYDLFDGIGYRPAKTQSMSGEVRLLDTAANNEQTTYHLVWRSLNDITTNQENVKVKLIPTDHVRDIKTRSFDGWSDESGIFALANENLVPEVRELAIVAGLMPDGKYAHDILFRYYLDDPEGDPCTLSFQVDFNDGQGFHYTNNITEYKNTSETCFIWHSYNDIQMAKDVSFKAIPNDGRIAEGKSKTINFALNNGNHPPELTIISAELVGDRVELKYTVSDPDPNDKINLNIDSLDTEGNPHPATNYQGDWKDVIPWNKWLVQIWEQLKNWGFAMNGVDASSYCEWVEESGIQVAFDTDLSITEMLKTIRRKNYVVSTEILKFEGDTLKIKVRYSDHDFERSVVREIKMSNISINIEFDQVECINFNDSYKINVNDVGVGLNEFHKPIELTIVANKNINNGWIKIQKISNLPGDVFIFEKKPSINDVYIGKNINDAYVNLNDTSSILLQINPKELPFRKKLYIVGKGATSFFEKVSLEVFYLQTKNDKPIFSLKKLKMRVAKVINLFYQPSAKEYSEKIPSRKYLDDVAFIANDNFYVVENDSKILFFARIYEKKQVTTASFLDAIHTLHSYVAFSGHGYDNSHSGVELKNPYFDKFTLYLEMGNAPIELLQKDVQPLNSVTGVAENSSRYSTLFLNSCNSRVSTEIFQHSKIIFTRTGITSIHDWSVNVYGGLGYPIELLNKSYFNETDRIFVQTIVEEKTMQATLKTMNDHHMYIANPSDHILPDCYDLKVY